MNNIGLLNDLTVIKDAISLRESSWDKTGKNADFWIIPAKSSRVLADIKGPGCITHLWMTQAAKRIDHGNGVFVDKDFFRKILIRIRWDNEKYPSVLVPLGDFFCMGNSMINSFNSLPITVSARRNNVISGFAAFNCYFPMPFNERAIVELVNESDEEYTQYFYVDYEKYDKEHDDNIAYFHAKWHRENPCGGWAHEITVNTPFTDSIPNLTGEENYEILHAKGAGQYVGCNISVANFQGTWWGEGDDMIFVDGEKFPPSLHGTGSEDYFNQAFGMQDNKYLFNGSSIFENNTGGYQTSYVFHITNPIRFKREIKVTIEHGHANHLANEYSSTAYWYQREPHEKFEILPVHKRLVVKKDFIFEKSFMTAQKKIQLTKDMVKMKNNWKKKNKGGKS